MRNAVRGIGILLAVAVSWSMTLGSPRADPGTAPAWYPAGFPYVPAVDPPGDDAVWESMECATVITLHYDRGARGLYRELRDAAEAADWTVHRTSDPDFEYRFDARRGNLEVLAMFKSTGDGTSQLTLYVLEFPDPGPDETSAR
jgi:hypothetical protein